MNCDDFSKRVIAFSDRDLSAADREALEQHAGVCPPCGQELRVYRAMREGFALLPRLDAPATLEGRVLERIEQDRQGALRRLIPWDISPWMRPAGLALAAGLLVVVVGRGMLRPAGESPGDERRVAHSEAPAAIQAPADDPSAASPRGDLELAAAQSLAGGGSPAAGHDSAPAIRVDERALAQLLGDQGVPLLPPGADRNFVIDRPEDVPGLMPNWGEGEAVSTPIF
jgi:hypothetical protein